MNSSACTVIYDLFDPGFSAWRLPIALGLMTVGVALLYILLRRLRGPRWIQTGAFLGIAAMVLIDAALVASMIYLPSHSIVATAYVGPPASVVEGEIRDLRLGDDAATFRVGDHAFAIGRNGGAAGFHDPARLATVRHVRIVYTAGSPPQPDDILRVETCDAP